MADVKELATKHTPTWCPGCGDFGILTAVKFAIAEVGLDPDNTVIVSGIGCGSKLPHFVKTYGFESLHGRALPCATGIKLANKNLNVIVITGDGDGLGIGANHFMHTMRRNFNITHVIQDNRIYGLTKGQYSPTTPKGRITPTSPHGALEEPVNPESWAIVAGATYVARGFALDNLQLRRLIADGIRHKGYALIDAFQLCPTYNKENSMQWYKEHIYKLEESGHNPKDKMAALAKALEAGDKLATGLFYVEEGKPVYEEQLPQMKEKALVHHDISKIDVKPFLERYM